MSRLFSWISGGVLLAALVATACSSTTETAACDTAQCALGNKCLPLNGETKCRKTCASNTDPAASCPFGYTCVTTDPEPFCVRQNAVLQKKSEGQWGAPCNAAGGLDHNPACDADQSFWCFGLSPTDGDAYCTRYDCATDLDCGPGFYCATTNMYPDVTSEKRSVGQTAKVCLKREYCATCASDLDCLPVGGRPQHCIGDADGNAFCSPECDATANCNKEARCLDMGTGYNACYPRAGRCAGDGSLCSPCRSDADCGQDGVCVTGKYTTERACAKKSASACAAEDCPSKPAGLPSATTGIACVKKGDDAIPGGYCIGVFQIAGEYADNFGCWTPAR